MGDIFKEQIVKRKPSGKDMAIKVGIILLYIALCFAAFLFIPGFALLVFAGLGFGVYLLFSMLNTEFEYIFTNGDLDIDCIYSKSRRKRVFSGDIKTIEIMVHINERGYDSDFNKAKITKDCSSGSNGNNTYKFAVNYKDKYMCVIFEPNDAMLSAMSPYLGQRRLIRKK